jgi:hypothetical protein
VGCRAKELYQTQDLRTIERRLKTLDEQDKKKDGVINIIALEDLLIRAQFTPQP